MTHKKMTMKTLFFSLSLLGILVMESNAQNPTALDIMKKNTELLKSNDEQAELIMTLVNEAGKERIRKVQQYIKGIKAITGLP